MIESKKKPAHSRRHFLKRGAWGSIGILTATGILANPRSDNYEPVLPEIPKGTTILFQGDSITDAHRQRDHYYANDAEGLGVGYVYQIVSQLLGSHPGKELRCYNRGISGNKVFQLDSRWEDDCLQLKPDVLSILIGVNDFWHTLSNSYKGTVEVYESDFRKLLDRTKKSLPNVKLIIAEPFVVKGGTAVSDPKWTSDFPAYQKAARSVARDYGASFLEYQSVFDKALAAAPVSYWCPDGVHPSIAGAHLMANNWLSAFSGMFK